MRAKNRKVDKERKSKYKHSIFDEMYLFTFRANFIFVWYMVARTRASPFIDSRLYAIPSLGFPTPTPSSTPAETTNSI